MISALYDSPNSDSLATTEFALGPFKLSLQHCTLTALYRLDSFGQQLCQFIRSGCHPGPALVTRSRFGDARIVRRRREGDVQILVCRAGALAIWVYEEQGATRRVPT